MLCGLSHLSDTKGVRVATELPWVIRRAVQPGEKLQQGRKCPFYGDLKLQSQGFQFVLEKGLVDELT
jgi:hypothetical protein